MTQFACYQKEKNILLFIALFSVVHICLFPTINLHSFSFAFMLLLSVSGMETKHITILLMAILRVNGVPDPINVITTTYGGSGADIAFGITHTFNGGYYTGGQSTSYGNTGADLWVVKFNHLGQREWDMTVGCAGPDTAYSVTTDKDGNCVAAGRTKCDGTIRPVIVKISELGAIKWKRILTELEGQILGIKAFSDGSYVVSGPSLTEGFIAKLRDEDQGLEWIQFIGSAADFRSVAELPNGEVGAIGFFTVYTYCVYVRLRSDGVIINERTEITSGKDSSYFREITWTSDGNLVAVGDAGLDAGKDAWVIKISPDGTTILWNKFFGGLEWDYGNSVKELSSGNLVFAGGTESKGAGEKDLWIFITDPYGQLLWEGAYDGQDDKLAYSVCVSLDDAIAAVGATSFLINSRDLYLVIVRFPCNEGRYLNMEEFTCELCYPLCKTCHGPTNYDCDECKLATALPVEDISGLCVDDCYSLEGYFRSGLVCKSK
eukprot:TRINITY_DN318_c0_g1_i1.p3 TRINITY_DN318_c0_g1~~TRINITY_DN318_c0_g1_i1.p3  ORF type:complete len:524 (-),score=9.32 TRINITY_DN318_c0_g1_i1:2842-4311(-)